MFPILGDYQMPKPKPKPKWKTKTKAPEEPADKSTINLLGVMGILV
jgi:hypothetical protein